MLGIFKTILFLVLSPFRAIYNWLFRRRIQKLYSEPPSPENQAKSSSHVVDFDQSWSNDWTSDKDTNASKIDQYRQQLIRQRSESKSDQTGDAVANIDFFSDMEPQNVRQAKVFVGSSNANQQNLHVNRLSVSTDEAYQPAQDAGLKDWGDNNEENIGWEADEEDVSDILREHRKMRKYNHVQ